jgi:hypothetical protein
MRNLARWSLLLLLIALGGCGSGGLASVSGTVTLDGKPLANALVNFQPLDGEDSARASAGTTDAEGRYSLRLVLTNKAGAVVGKHRVSIGTLTTDDTDPPPNKPLPKDPIPARYNAKSELTFEVPAGGTRTADFALTSGTEGQSGK